MVEYLAQGSPLESLFIDGGFGTLDSLQKGRPVSGPFDFSSVDGQRFRGRFLATWGNQKGPYQR